MSNLEDWAIQEVEIAKKRERGDAPENEFDYGSACYDSALKAFKSLCEDGHSGMSIGFTKNILNRLIDGKPLVPIEDVPDVWNLTSGWPNDDIVKHYQCKRMSSLFKDVYSDGHIEYYNIDQCYARNIYSGITWSSGLVSEVIQELYPITMPYMPGDRIEVATDDFLTFKKNGDFDTIGIFHALVNGEKIEINRYFAESQDYPGREEKYSGWVEITHDEYIRRSIIADSLRYTMKKNNCEGNCKLFDSCTRKEEYQHNRTYCDDFKMRRFNIK